MFNRVDSIVDKYFILRGERIKKQGGRRVLLTEPILSFSAKGE